MCNIGTLGLEQKLMQLRVFKDEQLVTSLEITTGIQVQQQWYNSWAGAALNSEGRTSYCCNTAFGRERRSEWKGDAFILPIHCPQPYLSNTQVIV